MLSVNGKSHVIRHVLTIQIFGALKKLRFGQNQNRYSINSTPQASQRPNARVTEWGHMQGWRGEVTCKGYTSCSGWTAFMNGWSCNSVNSLSQHRCQLVVRLKANKCYQKLFSFLSFYINLLNSFNLRASAVSAWPLPGSKPLAPNLNLRSQTSGGTRIYSHVWSIVL